MFEVRDRSQHQRAPRRATRSWLLDMDGVLASAFVIGEAGLTTSHVVDSIADLVDELKP